MADGPGQARSGRHELIVGGLLTLVGLVLIGWGSLLAIVPLLAGLVLLAMGLLAAIGPRNGGPPGAQP